MAVAETSEGQSFEYRLQRLPVGVIVLDRENRVRAASGAAQQLLDGGGDFFGVDIFSLHPPAAREKLGWLIASAGAAADGAASMIVATRMGNLLARATALRSGPNPEDQGYCMMFFMLGALGAPAQPDGTAGARFLLKLPIQKGAGDVISLVDVEGVVALSAQGHYAEATMLGFSAFCPRSLAAMEQRLDPALFLRVHRQHLVNIRHVRAAERSDGRWFLRMNDKRATLIPVSRQKVEFIRRMLAV
jgi:LytTR family transcriptional regulator, CO-responsive transcriptional regulator RcoM